MKKSPPEKGLKVSLLKQLAMKNNMYNQYGNFNEYVLNLLPKEEKSSEDFSEGVRLSERIKHLEQNLLEDNTANTNKDVFKGKKLNSKINNRKDLKEIDLENK